MREMKDSGIEWIGEIPKEWERGHLKYYTQIKTGGTPSTSNQVWFDGDVLWFTPGDFDKILLSDSKRKLSKLAVLFRIANLFPANTTMIVGIGGTAGKVGYTINESYCNQQITALINKPNTHPKYITYLMFCFSDVLKDNALYTTLPILNNQFVGDFSICIPKKLSEQEKIANFLDSKCSEIDATAEDIQKEISLLEDYKKSVITEAVTKGLNPDAEMKDSKIFYLGQINKNWNLTKVGYCCEKLYRTFEASDEALVCSNKGKVVPRGDTLVGLMTSDDNAMQGICKGDIAIHGMDTWHGAIACSDYDGKITRVVHVCKADGDNRFVVYWLQHLAFVGVYKLISNGVRGNTSDFRSWDKVADIYVPNPIKDEQQQIADFLDTKCSEIDTLIADKKRQLDILADYKKSLIYEYVTGKKEVPVNE
jgi:restriction endonuclease S subunit